VAGILIKRADSVPVEGRRMQGAKWQMRCEVCVGGGNRAVEGGSPRAWESWEARDVCAKDRVVARMSWTILCSPGGDVPEALRPAYRMRSVGWLGEPHPHVEEHILLCRVPHHTTTIAVNGWLGIRICSVHPFSSPDMAATAVNMWRILRYHGCGMQCGRGMYV
jgi:hypothetical protein